MIYPGMRHLKHHPSPRLVQLLKGPHQILPKVAKIHVQVLGRGLGGPTGRLDNAEYAWKQYSRPLMPRLKVCLAFYSLRAWSTQTKQVVSSGPVIAKAHQSMSMMPVFRPGGMQIRATVNAITGNAQHVASSTVWRDLEQGVGSVVSASTLL